MLTWCLVQKDEAMVLLAVQWGCLSEEEKAPYYEKAQEVKEAYLNKVWSVCMIQNSKLRVGGQVMGRINNEYTKYS